jgi:hypothetical protein
MDANSDSSSARGSAAALNLCGFSRSSPVGPPDGKGHLGREDEQVMLPNPTRGMTKAPGGSRQCVASATSTGMRLRAGERP